MSGKRIVGVVGNPNCGKTTLFNALTGAKQRVGNWPGVTVERKVGEYRFAGAYSLDVADSEVSLDEKIARDFVHAREADLIVNILDASNLERNLYLTSQLIEMGIPLLVVLNMVDVARDKGMDIDADALARRLGCPVVPLIASQGKGVDALKQVLLVAVEEQLVPTAEIRYDAPLEQAIAQLESRLGAVAERNGDSPRWLATRVLDGDDLARGLAGNAESESELAAIAGELADDVDILLADARYGFAHRMTQEAVKGRGAVTANLLPALLCDRSTHLIKDALESVRTLDVDDWVETHLGLSMLAKRRRALAAPKSDTNNA